MQYERARERRQRVCVREREGEYRDTEMNRTRKRGMSGGIGQIETQSVCILMTMISIEIMKMQGT